MNGAVAIECRFAISLITGFGRICVGTFLGAVAGRLASSEQGRHGADIITLACLIGGSIVGLFTGVAFGTSLGVSFTAACRDHRKECSPHGSERIEDENSNFLETDGADTYE